MNHIKLVGILAVGFLILYLLPTEAAAQPGRKQECPEWISLGISETPATRQPVSWRSEKGSITGKAQLVIADPSPNLEELAATYTAESTVYQDREVEKVYHRVTFTDLAPATSYLYRVGIDECWSEWIQFRTADAAATDFSFLYLGDVQYGINSLYPRVIRQAVMTAPQSALMIFGGDLTTNATNAEFDDFFHYGGWMLASKPVVPVPDGHEYPKDSLGSRNRLAAFWEHIFAYPTNAAKSIDKVGNYYFDYQNTRFILFNTFDYWMPGKSRLYREWLERVLKENPQKWTVVVHHQPLVPVTERRQKSALYDHLKPLYDQYDVDLVLSGHDHGYARGGIGSNNRKTLDFRGPVYIVSVSGPGMYALGYNEWYDRVASNTQMFQHVIMGDETIQFYTYTATGQLYDQFLIEKRTGKKRFVDKTPAVEEFTDIPPSQKSRYSAEQLQNLQLLRQQYLQRKTNPNR